MAPPRLVPEAGIIDSFAARGREQIFVNQYAAIPSLHVGWLAACGVLVALSVGRWWGGPRPRQQSSWLWPSSPREIT